MVAIFRDCGHRAALVEPQMQGQWIHLVLLIFVLLTHSCITVAVGKYSLCRCKLMPRRKRVHNSVCNQQGFLIRMYKWLRGVKCRTCIPAQVFILNITFGCSLITRGALGKLNASKFISISSEKMCACVHVCSFLSRPKWMLLVHFNVCASYCFLSAPVALSPPSARRLILLSHTCWSQGLFRYSHTNTCTLSNAPDLHRTPSLHRRVACWQHVSCFFSPVLSFTLPRLFARCCGRLRARAQISCSWSC